MRFTRRAFVQSAVAGLLVPLAEPIIELQRRIWALGALPDPDPARDSYTWTWDARRTPSDTQLLHAYTMGLPSPEEIAAECPPIAYADLAYAMCRLFPEPTTQLVSAATDILWTLD